MDQTWVSSWDSVQLSAQCSQADLSTGWPQNPSNPCTLRGQRSKAYSFLHCTAFLLCARPSCIPSPSRQNLPWPQDSSAPVALPSLQQSSRKGDQLQRLLLGSWLKVRTWFPISHQAVTIPAVWVWTEPVTRTELKGSKHHYCSPGQPSLCLCLSPHPSESTDKWDFLACFCQFSTPSPVLTLRPLCRVPSDCILDRCAVV